MPITISPPNWIVSGQPLRGVADYGLVDFNGELHEGKHEPIISKRLFDEAQAVMLRKSKPKTPKLKPSIHRGMFRCGNCGCFITTETQKGHNYLHCTKRLISCTQKYVREEVVTAQVNALIGKVVLGAELGDQMIADLQEERETFAHAQQDAEQQTKDELVKCEQKLDVLLDMRLNDQITEHVSKKHDFIIRKTELKGKLEEFNANRKNRFEPAIAFISEAKGATFLIAEGNLEKKRDFLKKSVRT